MAAVSVLATAFGSAALAATHPATGTRSSSRPLAAVASVATSTAGPSVPSSGAYLGAVVNFTTSAPETSQVKTLEKQIHRPLAIVSIYAPWADRPPLSTVAAAAGAGSIPMVSMHCGVPDAAIAAGTYDGLLRADAEAYKAYGGPVLLRWFWEMNLPNSDNNAHCLGASSTAGANYIAAWTRIWNIFHAVGANNVGFVWAPSAAYGAPSPAQFYPGASLVDWIGADLIRRTGYGPFPQMYSGFYATWVGQHKPLIISETGAVGSTAQVSWLDGIRQSVPTQFPALRAVVYVDGHNTDGNYVLTPGTAGMTAFSNLAHSSFFLDMP